MQSTKPAECNFDSYYKHVYNLQNNNRQDLIDISSETGPIIAIDCCGWYYQKVFNKNIIMLETIRTAHDYKLEKAQFTKLINVQDNKKYRWPNLGDMSAATVVLDRSVILRYKTIPELASIVNSIVGAYSPSVVKIRNYLSHIDDCRLNDRFYHWADFSIDNYVIEKFIYDLSESGMYEIKLRKKSS